MFSIYKKEIGAYFNSWTGYLVIGFFLLMNGLVNWVFADTSILHKGYASLDTFFELSPFLLLILIPAITMRSLAGEKAEGTLEWLHTRPISTLGIVLGKFFGGLTIFFLALLPTLVYVYSLHQLALPAGNVDFGSIVGSYIGLLVFAAALVAIGLFTSSICKQTIPAFLLAIILCLGLYLGLEALSNLLQWNAYAETVRKMGMSYHFDVLARGVMDSRSIIYFLSLVVFFLFLTNKTLLRSKLGRNHNKSQLFQIFVITIALISINVASNRWFARLDLTQDKRFSLSQFTRKTLEELPADIQVTVFLDGNLPPGFQQLRNSVRDLLTDLAAHSPRKVRFSFVKPLKGNAMQVDSLMSELSSRHLDPINLSEKKADGSINQQLVFPFAILADGEDEQVVHLLQPLSNASSENTINSSIEMLEYAFVSALRKISKKERKSIVGFTEGHGELSDDDLQDAIYTLSLNNQSGRIDLKEINFEGLDKVDVLVMAKPTEAFSEEIKFKLDYFLQNGGNLIVSLDQLNGSLDSLSVSDEGSQILLTRDLNLDDLWFNYGFRFNYDVLFDLHSMQIPMQTGSAVQGAALQHQIQLMPWPLHPMIVPSSTHPIVKNLGNLMTEFTGSLDTVALPGVKKEFLLYSSPYSRTLQSPVAVSLSMVQQLPNPEEFKSEPQAVAVLLEGKFTSAFQNRMLPDGISADSAGIEMSAQGLPAKLFAISDGDVFKNQRNPSDGSLYLLGWDRYTQQQYSNKSLLMNLVDYMTGEPEVIALGNKKFKLRLIDRVHVTEQQRIWQFIIVALPLIILSLAGWLQYYFRQKRYSKLPNPPIQN